MIRMTAIFLFLMALCHIASAAEVPLPDETQISQALARGASVRNRSGVLPEALMSVATILKAHGERCGFTQVKIEDAHGEGGATYRLTERIKAAMPRGVDMETTEYTGIMLLDADLALISGRQNSSRTVAGAKFQEKLTVSEVCVIKAGAFTWTKKEQRSDSKVTDPEIDEKSEQPVQLHGVRPIPRNALIALAAFASKEQGFKAGITSPFCVPSLDTGGMFDTFLIQPTWLETDLPHDKAIPTAKLVLRERVLEGEIGEKGLKVHPPEKDVWDDSLVWTFDGNLRIVALPPSPGSLVDGDIVDADMLDTDVPMDFTKIREAFKFLEDKKRKDDERAMRLPFTNK